MKTFIAGNFIAFLLIYSINATSQVLPSDVYTANYFHLLHNKQLGIVTNHTAKVGDVHLVDTLISSGFRISKIFAPEHGFRGQAGHGEIIKDEKDIRTGLRLISLYGKNKKPSKAQMADVDLMIYDIQDVGVRFYTFISTLHYVMEACAESGIPLMILDRPNPLGDYYDGPVLKPEFRSFVGMHPIPVVYGLTVAELAQMINGEGWLEGGLQCELILIKMPSYTHSSFYEVQQPPSPSLPNSLAIRLYPSLCFFEGTEISVGRGTDFAFQVAGYPDASYGDFSFTPDAPSGSIEPLHKGKKCYGVDLRSNPTDEKFSLKYLIHFYQLSKDKNNFISRSDFFDKLAGTDQLRKQIRSGMTEEQIRASWTDELKRYGNMRAKYILYPEKHTKCRH